MRRSEPAGTNMTTGDTSDTLILLTRAVQHLELAVRQSPGNPRYAALLGEAYLIQKEPDLAIAPLQASFQLELHPRTTWLLSLALFQLGQFDQAEKFANVAVDENEGFSRALALRGEVRRQLGKTREALADLREAVQLAPEEDHYRLRLASLLIEHATKEAGADASLNEALQWLQAGPPDGGLESWRYLLGCTYLLLSRPSEALNHLNRTDFPSVPEVAYRRGLCHFALGETLAARACLQQARVDPELLPAADRHLEVLEQLAPRTEIPPSPPPRVITLDTTTIMKVERLLETTGWEAPMADLLEEDPEGEA